MQSASSSSDSHGGHQTGIMALTVGAIGVVYGDIGTSPLYAFREAVHAVTGGDTEVPVLLDDVLGILSLFLWSMILIVTLKYVTVLLRIDNRGEGGTLALMALARSVIYRNTIGFLFLGMAGAALFYGDSIITPAISVLSAVEGMEVVAPGFAPYVVPVTLVIICALFFFQYKGTASVSKLFGPIMLLWFGTLGIMGAAHISDDPAVLAAVNPFHAARFVVTHGHIAFVTLGAIFLCVTGAEAIYADLGHFGRKPIQLAWLWYVFPCLALNYLGQGAMIMKYPEARENPFFNMVGPSLQLPLVILAACATVIASQAVITGAYSLTRQAVNLGLLPRMKIMHTSDKHSGQIYLPQVNYILMCGVIFLVLLFRSSSGLAAVYGISVAGALCVDAIMGFFVVWQIREWKFIKAVAVFGVFLALDLLFLGSNLLKLMQGGWVPLVIASLLMVLMTTWIQGTFILSSRARKREVKIEKFIAEYRTRYPDLQRVKGSAFFFAGDPNHTPSSLLQNIRHNKVLHESNIILSVKIEPIPHIAPEDRALVTHLNEEFSVVVLRFGYKDHPDVQEELIKMNRAVNNGIDFDWENTSLFLSRRSIKSHPKYGMSGWQDLIYIWLSKHAAEPTDFYKLPVGRVIEIGRHVII
ncbi:MAG TPA: potassium transporter Kup [Patescibacteria group bacterium]|nr:potassium transporter Kup [Patescibacteria group bacterium]